MDANREERGGGAAPRVPSVPPRAPSVPPPRPSRPPDAAGAGRLAFAGLWVALQVGLILTAGRREDGAFAFRRFAESTVVVVALFRELDVDGAPRRVRAEGGTWTARDSGGTLHRFAWTDRVHRPELAIFDRETRPPAGAGAHLAHLQAALDDVAAHADADAETRRWLLDVTVRRNGREPETLHLASAERRGIGGGR